MFLGCMTMKRYEEEIYKSILLKRRINQF